MTDSAGNWPDWGKLFNGASLLAVGLMACAAAATVVSGGACAPLLVAACATFVAGGMTVLNGAAEMIESATDYNYMRDTVYGGNEAYYETQKTVFSTAAEVGTVALGAVSGSPNLCFVAGTMVLISEGAKAIEDIEAGDHVWAWDETTGEVALKEVVETYINETDELVHVFVDGEEIITTPAHPFYSPVKGWTDAIHLRAGDILVLVNGEYVVVEKIQHEILEAPVTVYNFQVEDYHTYYVANGVLVHNRCGGETAATKRGKQMHKDWDYGQNGTTIFKEFSIPGVGRIDAVDFGNRIVYELKPNNPRAIRQGWKQLNKYVSALEELYGGSWIKILEIYD